jgi:hypothetical protein
MAQGQPSDSIGAHSKILEVRLKKRNLSPLAEELRIGERHLREWLPDRMKAIEAAEEAAVGGY